MKIPLIFDFLVSLETHHKIDFIPGVRPLHVSLNAVKRLLLTISSTCYS